MMEVDGYWYLATPYSDPRPTEVQKRVLAAHRAQRWMLRQGLVVYSPIVHWHETATIYDLPSSAQAFARQNRIMQLHAKGLAILVIEGTKESKGVRMEREWAMEWGQETWVLRPTTGLEHRMEKFTTWSAL
jgi:hypothetical protein